MLFYLNSIKKVDISLLITKILFFQALPNTKFISNIQKLAKNLNKRRIKTMKIVQNKIQIKKINLLILDKIKTIHKLKFQKYI